ncbi:regulator of nonsense transcripts 3B [Coccinella septempunctata]|uniref:regulator of nonsense transcripts 3B n=1 Tax=Coccinella septempunctata TaxID=41139 RepID=UPI001D095F53|nr:regulator of nonsense transcripts 3B [Coccinella septempunctata]
MALTEDSKSTSVKSQSTGNQKSEKREKPPTKVVIRRLPPIIEKDSLLNQISPLPDYDYFYLVNGEAALGENSFSRAYINFTNVTDVYEFKERFDNYVFLDQKGNEYPAVVEFAPFQKIPKKRNKVRCDPKCGTIETDPYYLEFLEYLKKPKEQEDKPEYSYQFSSENKEKDTVTTPLLEFVRSRRAERMRIREERREERRRKEKKIREEEKKKRSEEKFLSKSFSKMKLDNKDISDNEEREEGLENCEIKSENYSEKSYPYKNKERKFEERKRNTKIASPRKEFVDKRDFKNRKEHFKESKVDPPKKEEKQVPKKAKKYSEKREERKMEAQKRAEELEKKGANADCSIPESKKDKSESELVEKIDNTDLNKSEQEDKPFDTRTKSSEKEDKEIDNKPEVNKNKETSKNHKSSKEPKIPETNSLESIDSNKEHKKERIRNKDRPTIAIYRPGMLSKRKLTDGDEKESSNKETK